MSSLGKRLIQSAKEARKIARGEADPQSYKIHIPPKINVRAVRRRLNMTQEEFALRYRLTLGARQRLGTGTINARHHCAGISYHHRARTTGS